MTVLTKWKNSFFKILSLHRFIAIFMTTIAIFVAYHALIWFSFTSQLLDVSPPARVGDLARIGYQISSVNFRLDKDSLAKKHIEFPQWKGEQIDIITIGDSFSNGGAGGENPYYQDFIATKYDYTVMNINPSLFGENTIEAIAALYTSGLIDQIKPKAVLIESVGRYVVSRFSKPMNWEQNITKKALYNDLKGGKWGDGKPNKDKQYFITTANYKLPLYNLFYLFSPNALRYSNAYKFKLSQPLFNVKDPYALLVYQDDIGSLGGNTAKNIATVNENLNHLSDLLSKKDIRLFFMIPVDKYDLYHDYILNNPYGENQLFSLLRPMKKRYTFIDTKAVLLDALNRGKKDIYYADDTHWNNIASECVSNEPRFNLISIK